VSFDQVAPPRVATRARRRPIVPSLAKIRVLAEREAAVIAVVAFYAVALLTVLPSMVVQDSWLALVSGREVFEHGLPHTDTLAAWSAGTEWIDQQWLGQVVLYGVASVGGIQLSLLAHLALLVAGFGGALAASRSLGASTRSAALGGMLCMFVAPWGLQMRTQTLAVPLFVALLWLLAADSRAPSRRVLLVLPLLVLWANVHGTVVLAAVLVALRGLTLGFTALRARQRPGAISLALVALPFACLFASPYGTALGGYYRTMLVSPVLRDYVQEWGASLPSVSTLGFYLLGAVVLALLVRHRSRLTAFEQLALLGLLAAGGSAIRSITWFALAAAVLLPVLLDGHFTERRPSRDWSGVRRASVAVALTAVVVSLVVTAARPASWWTDGWPTAGAERVAALVAERPGARVFADDRYADWLVWEQPQLAGRIAYDVRFELLTRAQLERLVAFRGRTGGDWLAAIRGYDVLLLDESDQPTLAREIRKAGGFEVAYRDRRVAVLAAR
jgi:hypothetical protein